MPRDDAAYLLDMLLAARDAVDFAPINGAGRLPGAYARRPMHFWVRNAP